jgi:hypothetical protein
MWSRLEWWWAARTTEPERSADELERSTREVTKAIVQTLANRAFRRPELDSGDPLASAERQRAFDRETVAGYRETIAPELQSIRREYVARGQWTRELERLADHPQRPADLRDLVIALERLADEV